MFFRSAGMTQLTVKPMEYSVILISARLNANKMMRFFIIPACVCDKRLSSLCPKNNQIREPFFELNMNLFWCCLGQFTPPHYVLMQTHVFE